MMPISKDVLLEEISLAQRILQKWSTKITEGIPEVELPADEGALWSFMTELCGELRMVSDKCHSIQAILADTAPPNG